MRGVIMLPNAVIICSFIILNAEFLNGYSIATDSNAYNYNNVATTNGYLGSKDSYQNGASFYNTDDNSHKLSNHISNRPLINGDNQGSDTSNSYNGHSINNYGSEYTGYSNTYENSNPSDTYSSSNHATSNPFRGFYTSDANNNEESVVKGYSSDSIHKDSDFGSYVASSSSNSQRALYPGYSRPIVLENPGNAADNNLQGYHDFSGSTRYLDSQQVYTPYTSSSPASEQPVYSFGKGDSSYNLKGTKYNDIYQVPSGTRYTRRNPGYKSHNPPYLSASGSNSHFSKIIYNPGIYSSRKPNKYGYKYLSRYAPNNGVSYLSRERDGHYALYGKAGGKVIIIKDNRPNYSDGRVYSDEQSHNGGNGYRSRSGSFANSNGYSTSSNFDGYSDGNNNSYDDRPTMLRRIKSGNGPMIVPKAFYS